MLPRARSALLVLFLSLLLLCTGHAQEDEGLAEAREAAQKRRAERLQAAVTSFQQSSKGEVLILRVKPNFKRKPGELSELAKKLPDVAGLEGLDVRVVGRDTLVVQLLEGRAAAKAKDVLLQQDQVYQVELPGGEAHRRPGDDTPYLDLKRAVVAEARSSGRLRLKQALKDKVLTFLKGRKRGAVPMRGGAAGGGARQRTKGSTTRKARRRSRGGLGAGKGSGAGGDDGTASSATSSSSKGSSAAYDGEDGRDEQYGSDQADGGIPEEL